MDYETLSSELIRALRGRRSQLAFSRRLGYSANVLYTWEKGRRFPTAGVFFAAAQRVHGDIKPRLDGFLGVTLSAVPRGGPAVAELLSHLRSSRSSSELGRALGVNRATITRWLNAESQPRLPELLCWVELTTQRLLEFVSLFADPSQLPSTREAYRALAAQRTLAYDVPWSHAILRAIETSAYRRQRRHTPGSLARMVGLAAEQEPDLLAQLAQAGQIEHRRGRWVVKEVLTVDTRMNPEKNWQLKRHWAGVGLERMAQGPGAEGVFSYNLFAISNADLASIRELHVEYFERVRAIISACKSSERVVLINQQLVPLGLEAPGQGSLGA